MKDAWQREDRLSEMPRQRLTQSLLQSQADKVKELNANDADPQMAKAYQTFIGGGDLSSATQGMRPGNFPKLAELAEKRRASQEGNATKRLAAEQANYYRAMTARVQPEPLTPGGLDKIVDEWAMTGKPTAMGTRFLDTHGPTILNRLSVKYPNFNTASGKADFGANASALTKLTVMRSQVGSFEATAKKNLDLLEQSLAQLPDTGIPLLNTGIRAFQTKVSGDPRMSAFNMNLGIVQREAARILETATAAGSAAITDSARHDLEQIIAGNATIPQLRQTFATLRQDFGNRIGSLDEEIATIKGRIGAVPGQQQAPPGAAPGAPPSGAPPAPNLAQKYGL
jgi:hypothetical protein